MPVMKQVRLRLHCPNGVTTSKAQHTRSFCWILATLTADQVSSTTNGCNGRTVAAGASISRIVIDANLDDTGGEQGTNLRITGLNPTAQGGGRWYVEGTIVTDDADSDGSAIFVNAS